MSSPDHIPLDELEISDLDNGAVSVYDMTVGQYAIAQRIPEGGINAGWYYSSEAVRGAPPEAWQASGKDWEHRLPAVYWPTRDEAIQGLARMLRRAFKEPWYKTPPEPEEGA